MLTTQKNALQWNNIVQQEVELQWDPSIKKSKRRISVWPKVNASLSAFKKSVQFINSWVSWTKRMWSFLTAPTQKSLNQLLAFLNLYQHAKNQHFRALSPDWPHPFLAMPSPKNLKQHSFAWICTSMQKSVNSISSFLRYWRYSQFWVWDQMSHSLFWPYPTKKFSINF